MKIKPVIVGVMTTFHPSADLLEKVSNLARQCSKVIVVDDTGLVEFDFFSSNKVFFSNSENIYYLKNLRNSGISFSLNRGVKLALELNADYIVTFDDDTVICVDYIDRCLEFYVKNREFSIGAVSLSRGSCFSYGNYSFKVKRSLITSGLFCHASIYKNVSDFPEAYFIDLVDFYFSLEVRKTGLKLIEISDVGMIHKVGDMKSFSFPFRISVFNHTPFRIYYQVRNTIPFFIKFWRFDFIFCSSVLFNIFRIPFKIIFFEDRKINRLKYYFFGLWHGVLGKMGSL